MFNETCGPGTDPVEVGADAPICLTPAEASAYAASLPNLATVNVTPKAADSWTNYALYGGLGLVLLLVFSGGKRR
jgi:hypothetical protein